MKQNSQQNVSLMTLFNREEVLSWTPLRRPTFFHIFMQIFKLRQRNDWIGCAFTSNFNAIYFWSHNLLDGMRVIRHYNFWFIWSSFPWIVTIWTKITVVGFELQILRSFDEELVLVWSFPEWWPMIAAHLKPLFIPSGEHEKQRISQTLCFLHV